MREGHNSSIFDSGIKNKTPIPKSEISRLVKESRGMGHEQQKALERIFGPQLESLKHPSAGDNATSLFLPLLSEIFDKRTTLDLSCSVPYPYESKRTIIKEKATPIHTRSSLISKILDEKDHMKNGTISMGRIDLQRFREADFDVKDPHGIRPADVIINTTARTIREALKEVWDTNKIDYKTNSYEVGRYGGDELIIAFIGEQAQAQKEAVMDIVIKKLGEKKGYYKDAVSGLVKEEPISLKIDKNTGKAVEWIDLPKSDDANIKKMYQGYLERGLILNEAHFEREKKKYTKGTTFDFDAYKADYPDSESIISYPPDIQSLENKISFLSKNHSELAVYFNLAQIYDKEAGGGTERQETLLSVVESSIFDKLLKDMIYSRPHFIEHMGKGEIGQIHVFDFKFLKETNLAMTYTDADNNIKALWKKIKTDMPAKERSKIIVTRFAGAIYIGVKKGEQLSTQFQKDLDKITSLPFGTEERYPVPIGHAYIDLRTTENNKLDSHTALNNLEEASDRSYYFDLVRDIQIEQKKENTFISDMMNINLDTLATRPYQSLSKKELYALFLRGQRKEARIGKLIHSTENDMEFNGDKIYSQLCEALNNDKTISLSN